MLRAFGDHSKINTVNYSVLATENRTMAVNIGPLRPVEYGNEKTKKTSLENLRSPAQNLKRSGRFLSRLPKRPFLAVPTNFSRVEKNEHNRSVNYCVWRVSIIRAEYNNVPKRWTFQFERKLFDITAPKSAYTRKRWIPVKIKIKK